MTRDNSSNPNGQPTLTDLMVRFLATRSDAATMAAVEPASGDVEPHEVAAGFRVDPRAAWTDAVAAIHAAVSIPSEWSSLVNQPIHDQEPPQPHLTAQGGDRDQRRRALTQRYQALSRHRQLSRVAKQPVPRKLAGLDRLHARVDRRNVGRSVLGRARGAPARHLYDRVPAPAAQALEGGCGGHAVSILLDAGPTLPVY